MPLPVDLRTALEGLFGADVAADDASREACSHDTSRYAARPDLVVYPRRHEQVEALVQLCRAARVAVTARGRGTGTTGAAVPMAGGIVVDFERMQRIIAIDPANRVAIVEPGVLNGDLQRELAARGFFWPPDPASADICSVGGNLACNSGGPRAVKYGATRDNTLALRAVAGTGAGFRCGAAVTKNATGYDLARLLVGSEGTLALITEATLKLVPLPAARRTLRATYDSIQAAADAVARIMAQPATPCALEFMDAEALRLAREDAGTSVPMAEALLMIEVDGSAAAVEAAAQAVGNAAHGAGLLDIVAAANDAEAATLWTARRALSPALRRISEFKINEDVVVPVSRIPDLVASIRSLAAQYALPIVSFGHAGNGNLHVNLLPRDAAEQARAVPALAALFTRVIELGGTLSGEHGVGMAKRAFMAEALEPATLALLRAVKQAFDPEGILNPGKLLP